MLEKCDCLKYLRNAVFVALALWGIHWAWYWLAERIMAQSPQTKLSEALEASGAMFSGLAFLAALGTLWVQRKDLELQRQELQDTRGELKGQREQMELQNARMVRQSFENGFFSLINLHNDIVCNISEDVLGFKSTKTYSGRSVISRQMNIITSAYKDAEEVVYEKIIRENSQYFSSYVKSLYSILMYVDSALSITDREKRDYAFIVKSTLSAAELQLLFYVGLFQEWRRTFVPLVEKYSILEGVDLSCMPDELCNSYSPSAYGLAK